VGVGGVLGGAAVAQADRVDDALVLDEWRRGTPWPSIDSEDPMPAQARAVMRREPIATVRDDNGAG
jgi:hypothetical protein